MPPRYLASAICMVSFTPHSSTLMIIHPSFRTLIQNVSSHCTRSHSLSTAELPFTKVLLNVKSVLLTVVLYWAMGRNYMPHCRKEY